jgi:hypothetical protein
MGSSGLAQKQLGQGLKHPLGSTVTVGMTTHAIGQRQQPGLPRGPVTHTVLVAAAVAHVRRLDHLEVHGDRPFILSAGRRQGAREFQRMFLRDS